MDVNLFSSSHNLHLIVVYGGVDMNKKEMTTFLLFLYIY